MCRNLLILATTIIITMPAWAVGTVNQSLAQIPQSTNYVYTENWTADAGNGSVPATTILGTGPIQGYRIVSVEIAPGSPAPTNLYTVTITDFSGADLLGGSGASQSSTTATILPSLSTAPPIYGSLTVNVTGNSVNSAQGRILVYFAPVSQVIGNTPTGASLTGNNLLTGNNTFQGTNTYTGLNNFTGTTNVTVLNQVQYCDQFAGATADVKLNACIGAVIAAGGGIANAQGLTGVQTIAAQVNIGNTSSIPVTLLMSPNSNWGITITNGTSCGLKVFNNGNILAAGTATGQEASISSFSASTNVNSLLCTNDSLGSQTNTFRIEGLQVSNVNGGTMADSAMNLRACKDDSIVADSLIVNPSGVSVHIGGTTANSSCGPLTMLNNWIIGGNGAVNNTTAQPLLINGSTTGGVTSSINFIGGTIQQPGSGQNAIIIDGGTNFFVANVNFSDINGNGTLNAADGGTPYMRISHAGPTTWKGGQIIMTVAASAYCFRLENSANNLSVINADCTHTNMVNNAVTGVNFTSSTSSIINSYNDQPNTSLAGFVCPEQSSAPGFAVTGADVFYCDSVNHQMLGSYNNSAFSKVPLVGSNNIWTAGQFFNTGTLFPTAAGGTDIGAASNPFGNLWLGTAATNNFKFAPAATSAARTISIPDPGVNTNLALNLTATSAAFATATTAGTCVQNTTAVAGAATTMAVSVAPVSTPGVGAVWSGFVSSAGNVTINECAVATSAGGTIAFNIRVTP